MPGALYVVATPIGNLEDITTRAVRVLRTVTLIASEDTRTSRPLLQRLGIGTRMLALHTHNEVATAPALVERIRQGEAIALITDAGTPGVSDPGARLVDAVHMAGLRVVPVPGPSAMTALLSVAGLADGRFHFEGFLPSRPKARRERLEQLISSGSAFMFFEAPHRIAATAADLTGLLPEQRQIVVGRELTKQFEQIVRLAVAELPAWLAADSHHQRGEFALLVEAAPAIERGDDTAATVSELGERVLRQLTVELPPRQAARLASRISGDEADALYRRAVALRAEGG